MVCALGCCCCEEGDNHPSIKPMSKSPMKRSICCTDIIFLIIFIAFWIVMVYIGIFAFLDGAALRLVYGYDSFGNTCNSDKNSPIENVNLSGQDTRNRSMTKVFFFDVFNPKKSVQLCVKHCPNETLITKDDVMRFALETGSQLCSYGIDPNDYPSMEFSGKGPCPSLPIPKSSPIMNRCVPTAPDNATAIIDEINQNGWADKIFHDIIASWKQMVSLCFVAVVIALIFVFVLRFVAGIIVWLTLLISAVGTIAATIFLWWSYADMKKKNDAASGAVLKADTTNEKIFLGLAIVSTVITVLLLLILLVMRSRIALVVALFKEAGKCIGKMPSLLLQPVWTFVVLLVFLAYSLAVLAFLTASGTPVPEDRGFSSSQAVSYIKTQKAQVFWWYQLVGIVWTSEFILACQQMVVAGAVALWYFTRDKSELCCAVGKATCRVILHHLGSVAFGAFIITLVKLPRLILMYIQKQASGVESCLMKFILKCCMCCLWCLEKILKYINQNAYTIVVIEGKSFCPAAKTALSIIVSNALRVAAINSVGDFVLFLAKIAVTASTTAIAVIWLKQNEELHFWAIPVIFVCGFAFLIAHCFLSIYEMVIDTLLLCFCEDCKLHDGSEGKEYFMGPTLMEFVSNGDEALKNLKKRRSKERK